MRSNPFLYGNVTPANEFINRDSPLRRVVSRLLTGGQSSALVGEPRMGKTSALNYLSDPSLRQTLYGDRGNRMTFSIIDSHVLSSEFSRENFWEYALKPIHGAIVGSNSSSAERILHEYRVCQENKFNNFALESFFEVLKQENLRFILMIDEFDSLVNHKELNSVEFFGGLRSLSSRSGGAMALVIASRQSIHTLNTQTQHLNPTSSPFFNIFKEICLGGFPEKDIVVLLRRAKDIFSPSDNNAIRTLAGRHPYLLQVAGSALWEAYEDRLDNKHARWTYMGNTVYREQRGHFLDTWRLWSSATRKAFTTIALCNVEIIVPQRTFLLEPFVKGLRDLGPEIKDLEEIGLVIKNTSLQGGWAIESQVMIWWLADELVKVVREDKPFEQWLQAQELDNLLTRKEKESLAHFAISVANWLQQGATKFIETFAEGIGKSIV